MSAILVDYYGRTARITLNRPERLNAYTPAMGVELFDTLARMERDDAVRAIVITGAGRAFCAGADLRLDGATFADDRYAEAAEREAEVRPWEMRTPIIAALNGPAVGVGATLPLQWDIRIASDRASLGFVFTRRGIIPEAGSTWILPRLVGLSAAMDLMLTGRTICAHEALSLGLVSRVVPPAELIDTAHRIAQDIADNTAPLSVAMTKKMLWRHLSDPDPGNAKAQEDVVFQWCGDAPDAAEGVAAFLEKRAPHWHGKKTGGLPDGW